MSGLTRESRGFVVRGQFPTPSEYYAWWYGPDHGWGTTWGGLDYSVHVFATRREATAAVRAQGLGHRRPIVETVQEAVAFAIEQTKHRREAAVAAGRTNVAVACTDAITKLRNLQRSA